MVFLRTGRPYGLTPPHPLQSACVLFWCLFDLKKDYMYSEMNFTQRKRHFSPNYKNNHPSLLLAAPLLQNDQLAV